MFRKRKEIRYGGESKYDEYIEDKGSALSSLTVLAVFIGTHMAEILPFLFAGKCTRIWKYIRITFKILKECTDRDRRVVIGVLAQKLLISIDRKKSLKKPRGTKRYKLRT